MDTWATSSLSPEIAGHWGSDLFDKVYPMDLRLQAHEIIRPGCSRPSCAATSSSTVCPSTTSLISGWVLDPNRKR